MNGAQSGHALAVTWEEHRRTRELCDWLKLPLHTLTADTWFVPRYLRLGVRTLRLLAQRRPKVVYVQNPSLVLALLVIVLRPFCGRYRIIMDAHNEAVQPFTHDFWPIPQLARLALRAADITIVTNAGLAEEAQRLGARPYVLPDRLPTPPIAPEHARHGEGPLHIMVVATYAADEPIAEIAEAARLLGDQYQFHCTGKAAKLAEPVRKALPANFRQTGFLSEDDYWQLMASSHIVLDLTLKPNCLVCGAYEALSMRRPMVLTDNPPTVELFGNAAVFPKNDTAAHIAHALEESRRRYPELAGNAARESGAFAERWIARAQQLKRQIADWTGTQLPTDRKD